MTTLQESLFDLQDQLNEQPSVAKKDKKFYRIRIIGDGTTLASYGQDDGKVEQSPIEQYINTSSILIPGSGPMFALVVKLVGLAISFLSTRVSGLLTSGSGFLATLWGRDGLFFCIVS